MIKVLAETELSTGYYGDVESVDITATINITCASCSRLIYSKECRGDSYIGPVELS